MLSLLDHVRLLGHPGPAQSPEFSQPRWRGRHALGFVPMLEPLAVSPREAAALLAISKRTVSHLIRSRKLVAHKHGKRTLVDVESIKAFYATLPQITAPRLLFGERAHVRPKSRARQ